MTPLVWLFAGAPLDDEDIDTDSFHDLDTGRRIPLGSAATAPRGILKKSALDSPPVTQSPPEYVYILHIKSIHQR